MVLDQGKPQSIAVFHAGSSSDYKPIALTPGALSNRQDSRGQPLNGATAVLVDMLNTPFDYKGYALVGLKELLRSLSETDTRIALYSLGRNLHILHDFTDDSQRLTEIAAVLDLPHGHLPADISLPV
jgi:hypothetical protein